jgi:hypothetical protein
MYGIGGDARFKMIHFSFCSTPTMSRYPLFCPDCVTWEWELVVDTAREPSFVPSGEAYDSAARSTRSFNGPVAAQGWPRTEYCSESSVVHRVACIAHKSLEILERCRLFNSFILKQALKWAWERLFKSFLGALGASILVACDCCGLVEVDLHDIMAKRAYRTPRTGERNAIVRRHLEMAPNSMFIAAASDAGDMRNAD